MSCTYAATYPNKNGIVEQISSWECSSKPVVLEWIYVLNELYD